MNQSRPSGRIVCGLFGRGVSCRRGASDFDSEGIDPIGAFPDLGFDYLSIVAPPSTPDLRYKGRNIHEVLDMTVEDALAFYQAVPVIARKLQRLYKNAS
ncbi:MAG: hypothetical protein WAV07_17575 [Candidatus Contendobacter sp.]